MKLTLSTLTGEIVPIEVPDDMTLGDLRGLCQIDAPSLQNVEVESLTLMVDGKIIASDRLQMKLGEADVNEQSMFVVTAPNNNHTTSNNQTAAQNPPHNPFAHIDFASIRVPGSSSNNNNNNNNNRQNGQSQGLASQDPANVRQMLLNDPQALASLKQNNLPLHDALVSGDLEFTAVFEKQMKRKKEENEQRIRLLTADPFDKEAQALIEQQIKQQNIEHALETAMEHTPENFGVVHMLYIQCRVNGHEIKAFVDSAQMHIENDHLPVSFTILEDQSMDVLLGLDMLKRHQCCIDLKHDHLLIGTTGTTTRFLSEGELPQHARLNHDQTEHMDTNDEDAQLAKALQASASDVDKPTTSTASPVVNPPKSTDKNVANTHNNVSEANVTRLMSMGFAKEACVEALNKAGGNADQAAIILLAKNLAKPNA